MRLTIRPLNEPSVELDVTDRIVAAIADQISQRIGGNPVLNALEAEVHLRRLLATPIAATVPDDCGAHP